MNLFQIATTSPTCQGSHLLSSGPTILNKIYGCKRFWDISFSNFLVHTQHVRLSKPEPEPLLQHDVNLYGNVATKHLGDLRESDNYLRQPDFGAHEAEVPELHGRTGADNVSH